MKLNRKSDLSIREIYIVEIPMASAATFALLAGAVYGLCVGLHASYIWLEPLAREPGSTPLTIWTVLKSLLVSGCVWALVWSTLVCIVAVVVTRLFNAIAATTGGMRLYIRDARDL